MPCSRSRSRVSTIAGWFEPMLMMPIRAPSGASTTGAGHERARGVELAAQAVQVVLPILGPLAVGRHLRVAGAAGEVGRRAGCRVPGSVR